MVVDELAAVVGGENEESDGGEDGRQGGEPENAEMDLEVVAAEPADKEPEDDGDSGGDEGEQGQVLVIGGKPCEQEYEVVSFG